MRRPSCISMLPCVQLLPVVACRAMNAGLATCTSNTAETGEPCPPWSANGPSGTRAGDCNHEQGFVTTQTR